MSAFVTGWVHFCRNGTSCRASLPCFLRITVRESASRTSASTRRGWSPTFFSFSSSQTGSMNSYRARSRLTRSSSFSVGSSGTAASSKPWWSNQAAFPICTNRSGACLTKSSSWSLKRNSKSEKNAACPPMTLNG